MSDDQCACGHWAMDHSELGCEDCMCEEFRWEPYEVGLPDKEDK